MKATLSFWSSLWLLMLFPAQAAQITLSSITHTNTIKGSDLLLLDSYLAPGSYTTRVITLSDFLATGGGGGGSGVFVANSHIITPTDLANATLHIGSGVSNWWGNSTDDAIVIVHDSSAGDSTAANWAIAATDSASNSTNYAFFGMAMSTGPQPFATITVAALTNSQDLAAPSSHWNLYLQPDQNVARIQMVNQGTNTFDLGDTGALSIRDYLSLSGYTNQIGDNGSALTYNGVAVGGGGDTIWTNSDGTITTTSTNSNVLSFTSQLADNAANVAMVVDTASAWSSLGARLARFDSAGTPKLSIFQDGNMAIGKGAIAFGPAAFQTILMSHDESLGETPNVEIYAETIDSSDYNYSSYFDITARSGATNGLASLEVYRAGTNTSSDVLLSSDDTIPGGDFIRINSQDVINAVKFNPNVVDSDSAVAHRLNTVVSLTNNTALLFQIANASVPKVTVPFDGSITTGGNTNRLSWKNAASGLTITASTTNAIIATIDGRKVYLLIANETPP